MLCLLVPVDRDGEVFDTSRVQQPASVGHGVGGEVVAQPVVQRRQAGGAGASPGRHAASLHQGLHEEGAGGALCGREPSHSKWGRGGGK